MSYLESVQEKRANASNTRKEQSQQDDTDTLIRLLKENQLASLMGAQKQQPVVLADSSELVDHFAKFNENIKVLLTGKHAESLSKEQVTTLKSVGQTIEKLTSKPEPKVFNEILKALKALKPLPIPAPIVNVPEPKVVVKETKQDFTPVVKAIKDLKLTVPEQPEAPLKLDDFKAQDILDSGKDKQYIGFVHPTGTWYIIENFVNENKLRYLFGRGNYASAFKEAPTYQYSLLDEAYNAL